MSSVGTGWRVLIGRGGMGEVYRAFDTVKGRMVALKRLSTHLAADTEYQARFRRESQLAARLWEPHVIPIHDFGEIDGQLFIDMRLVEGANLATLLTGQGGVAEASVMEAHALALEKDVNGCLAALRKSEGAFAVAEERERPDWLSYFDGAYLAAKSARCLRDIGRFAEAESFARRSLDMIDGYDRGRLFNLVLLASVLTAQRKVDEACQTASVALRIAHDVRSVRTTADLADLAHRLAPFRAEPAVRLLHEEMRANGILVYRA